MSTPSQTRYEPPPPAVSVRKARPSVIGLAAAATMLVLIGAIGNPPATRSLVDNIDFETFSGRLRASLSTFSWHLTDLGNDVGHLFLANVVMDLAVVVLVFVFVAVVAGGSGSFWRTFLGAWIAVLAASVIGGYVRSAVVDEKFTDPTLHNKAEAIFFSAASPRRVARLRGARPRRVRRDRRGRCRDRHTPRRGRHRSDSVRPVRAVCAAG